jgi:hypothetical protein
LGVIPTCFKKNLVKYDASVNPHLFAISEIFSPEELSSFFAFSSRIVERDKSLGDVFNMYKEYAGYEGEDSVESFNFIVSCKVILSGNLECVSHF